MPRGEPDQEPLLDPEVVRTVLREALASGGRVAEVFAESRGSTAIRLDDGRVEEVVSGRSRRVSSPRRSLQRRRTNP